MLIKHPGLTLVGGLAISVAIAIGATFFDIINDFVRPTLPFEDGARIVGIQTWDTTEDSRELRSLHDFVAWRDEVRTVEDLGAFTRLERNLITEDGTAELVEGATMTASAFQLVRVPPLLGRPLVETDEQEGAAPVVVLGYGVWQSRFEADPNVVGRVVQLGAALHTVVGVMPEGFAFPVQNELWVPLRLGLLPYERGQGPETWIFGRLADGVTFEEAQAELTTIGLRAAAEFPNTNEHLRPQVVPYTLLFSNPETWSIYGIQIVFVMLLVLVCANVATLVFARTAARQAEIVVRNTLGGSRSRVILQLFVETLVLASLAAMIGLVAAAWAQTWIRVSVAEIGVPFWSNPGLAPMTVLYVAGLTVLGAVVVGLIPALKVTGPRVEPRFRHAAAGGGQALRFGSLWTGVIVTQVALIVAFLPSVISLGWEAVRSQSIETSFSPEEYLAVQLDMDLQAGQRDSAGPEFLARFRATYGETLRRVATEPGVAGVTLASRLPGMAHPKRTIEVDGASTPPASSLRHEVSIASIERDFFSVLGVPILSGRAFNAGDFESGRRAVIVNRSFVQQILDGRSPIDRRLRYTRPADEEPGPWYEVVGVVTDLSADPHDPREAAALYHPLTSDPVAPGASHPVVMAVHVATESESFASRLRAIGAEVDPTVRLRGFVGVDDHLSSAQRERMLTFSVVALATIVAVLLSAAGIYSLVSFTVFQRTREIGIRMALGAHPRRIVAVIFSRALAQIGLGVVAGAVLIALFRGLVPAMPLSMDTLGLIVTAAAGMLLVGLLACALPVRRALRIQPTDALGDGG